MLKRKNEEKVLIISTKSSNKIQFNHEVLLNSTDINLMENWTKKIGKEGQVITVMDEFLNLEVLEVAGSSKSTFIHYPDLISGTRNHTKPFLNLIINTTLNFSFALSIEDENSERRKISFETDLVHPSVRKLSTDLPLKQAPGWHHLCIDLPLYFKKIFRMKYKKLLKIRVFPVCQVYKIFMSDTRLQGDLRVYK